MLQKRPGLPSSRDRDARSSARLVGSVPVALTALRPPLQAALAALRGRFHPPPAALRLAPPKSPAQLREAEEQDIAGFARVGTPLCGVWVRLAARARCCASGGFAVFGSVPVPTS